MNKKTILVLAALGMTQAKEVLANEFSTLPVVGSNDPAIVAESLQINVDTVRVLKMFADMGALQFNSGDGSVQIDPTHLPNFLIAGLSESNEVVLDQDTDVFVLTDSFVNVLATNHVFTRLGQIESVQTNKAILERLKERSTPIPREDQVIYAKASFIAGH